MANDASEIVNLVNTMEEAIMANFKDVKRSGPSKAWKRFLSESWNKEVIWNMDANDEVRDILSAYTWFMTSNYFKGYERDFEQVFETPWMMRDLYQLFNYIWKRERDDLARYARLKSELGHIRDQDGRALDFRYLVDEFDFEPMPDESEVYEWEEALEAVPF